MKFNRSARGFTLVEVMVVAAVGSIMALGIASLMTYQTKNTLGARAVAARDQLSFNLNKWAGSVVALKKTANMPVGGINQYLPNTVFTLCLMGGTAATDCPGGTKIGLTLLDETGRIAAGPDSTVETSPPAKCDNPATCTPAVYDTYGASCGPAGTLPSNQCPLIAYASFKATCANAAPTCLQAQSISITYTVTQAPGVKLGIGQIIDKNGTKTITSQIPLTGSSIAGGVPNGMQLFTTSGTFLVPDSITRVRAYVQGAGGGGVGYPTYATGGLILAPNGGPSSVMSSLVTISAFGGGGGKMGPNSAPHVYPAQVTTPPIQSGILHFLGRGGIDMPVSWNPVNGPTPSTAGWCATYYSGGASLGGVPWVAQYGAGGSAGGIYPCLYSAGASGNAAVGILSVTPGETLTITVGTGGTGAMYGGPGGDGAVALEW